MSKLEQGTSSSMINWLSDQINFDDELQTVLISTIPFIIFDFEIMILYCIV